jgi:hypothetical protein
LPVFEPPQDEPHPPTNLIEEFIRNEVPRLIRSQIEEQFSSSNNLELTRETLSTSITTLIERAIDISILRFKTTAAQQSIAQSNPKATGFPANLALIAPPNAQRRVPEREDHSANQDLLIPSYSSLPTVYNSVKSRSDLRPISSNPTVGSDSATTINILDIPANEAVSVVQQDDKNDCLRRGHHDEASTSISTSSKGKQRAIYPANDADDYQDSHAYQGLQLGHLNRSLGQDDQFSQSNVQLDMDAGPNFEDFYLDSGLEPDSNWFTEVSQRLV